MASRTLLRLLVGLTLALLVTACGGDDPPTAADPGDASESPADPANTQDTTGDASGSPDPATIDLGVLDGEYTLTGSNPRFVEATGRFETGTAVIEAGRLVVRGGDAMQDTPADSTVTLGCGTDSCTWSSPEGRMLMLEASDGPPFQLVSPMDGAKPSSLVCGYTVPDEAYVVETIDGDSITYVAAVAGGFGEGGCEDSFVVLFDIEMTRM